MDSNRIDFHDIRVHVAYNKNIMITYIQPNLTLNVLLKEIQDICKFDQQQPFTLKWIDEDGDPCIISVQEELDEALRLYELNKDNRITIHVFPNKPRLPGLPCPGEEEIIYRGRRWRKLYRINGHIFQPKRFNKRAFCAYCQDRIWGLGRQGLKCNNCKLMIHKKCHKFIKLGCLGHPDHLSFDAVHSANITARYTPSSKVELKSDSFPTDSISSNQLQRIGTPLRKPHRANVSHSTSNNANKSTNVSNPKKSSTDCIEPVVKDVGQHSKADSEQVKTKESRTKDNLTFERVSPGLQVDESGGPKSKSDACQYNLTDFNLLRVIGRGSYAKVLMVELKQTKRVYAMKVIKKEKITDYEDIDWVQTEKHVFETASNYPFLVGLHSCFQSSSRLFFIIEFVRGGDLMFHMQRRRRLPEEHARFYAAEISLALNFLHKRGIIYRDLKLDNVLLDHEGHIKLTDYGMCKEGIRPGDTTSTFCGTPNYIAPEILRGEDYDFSVDWWALGILLYEMLAGRSPFDLVGAVDNPDQNTEDFLFQMILEKTIRIPRSVSVKAQLVLKGFLNKNPLERLGCAPDSSFEDVCNHRFFKPIDWEALEAKQLEPPYKPVIESNRDLEYFDPHFTNEPVILTPDDPKLIASIDQSEFEGFEYVNPLLMSLEDFV